MRYDISDKVLDENDISFYDTTTIPWDEFTFPSGFEEYPLAEVDIPRLYNLMINRYNNSNYWDIILNLNNIVDPIEDLYPTLILKLPTRNDLETFIRDNT